MRGLADGDAAGAQGLPRPRRRPGDVPERHDLDAHRAPARRRGAATAGGCSTGSSRPAARRSTRTRSTSARSRSPARPGRPSRPVAYCPRRTVLDKLLVDAAAEAGAEVREGFTVEEVVVEDGRVIGIRGHGKDGRTSPSAPASSSARTAGTRRVAEAVGPEQYNEKPPILCGYYTYWSGLPMDGRFEVYIRPTAGFARGADERRPDAGRRRLAVRGVRGEQARRRGQLPARCSSSRPSSPSGSAARTARRGSSGTAVPNFFRKPFGPGWALVGDAGYNKDFITAQGITDAFRDAELCATALDDAFSGARSFDDAMAEYQRTRDEHVAADVRVHVQLATLEPPPPEMQQLLGAVHGNQEAMDGFARVNAGVDVTGRVLRRGERRPHLRRRRRWRGLVDLRGRGDRHARPPHRSSSMPPSPTRRQPSGPRRCTTSTRSSACSLMGCSRRGTRPLSSTTEVDGSDGGASS